MHAAAANDPMMMTMIMAVTLVVSPMLPMTASPRLLCEAAALLEMRSSFVQKSMD